MSLIGVFKSSERPYPFINYAWYFPHHLEKMACENRANFVRWLSSWEYEDHVEEKTGPFDDVDGNRYYNVLNMAMARTLVYNRTLAAEDGVVPEDDWDKYHV